MMKKVMNENKINITFLFRPPISLRPHKYTSDSYLLDVYLRSLGRNTKIISYIDRNCIEEQKLKFSYIGNKFIHLNIHNFFRYELNQIQN